LNLVLIPRYGIVGASIATVVSYSILGLIPQYLIKTTRQIMKDYFRATLKPVFCSVLMSVFILCVYPLNIFLLVALSAGVYFVSLLVTRGLDQGDFGYLRQIARRRSEA
jgi:O-antigen/teichoic acid export membrane protein